MDVKEAGKIKKLDEVVINRIAAGEVIQRPANALKELIENSLDAQATNILITVKDGGLKLMQIQDNGCGIRKDDFGIVCERFTTSKLREFEDLNKITTYGFRGEALASISHVAHLTITSKTRGAKCAFRAAYIDGKLKNNVTPIAGNQGTQITVEDLFYNMMVRKNALRSPAEEYQKISEIVGNYAVHNSAIGFSLKKYDSNVDIRTPIKSNVIANIRTVYGPEIAKELLEFDVNSKDFHFTAKGCVTNANYSSKKFHFVLFINHRLVSMQSLKKSLDQIFATYLPKNMHPFIYLSLEVNPKSIDVNVHPTKHEVNLLNEENIVDIVTSAVETKLLGANNSRVYYVQTKLPGADLMTTSTKETMNKTTYDKDLVRTDASSQKLERFFGPARKKSDDDAYEQHIKEFLAETERVENRLLEQTLIEDFTQPTSTKVAAITSRFKEKRITVKLRSVLDMQAAIERNCNDMVREIFAEHVFVGTINAKQSCIQHGTKLYLCDTFAILQELFYQFMIFNFQAFNVYRFEKPLPIIELAKLALDLPETGWTEEEGDKNELAQRIVEILEDKSVMLNDYFALQITDGCLVTLPILIDKYIPSMCELPMYILRLATEVNWDEEKLCFETFARETAAFYAHIEEKGEWQFVIQHVLYPAIKEYFTPSSEFRDNGAILQCADLPNLYKVFERC